MSKWRQHIISAPSFFLFFLPSFCLQFPSKSFPHRCSRILINLLRIVGRWWTAWICGVVCWWLLLGENYGLALAAGCTAADRWRRATDWIGGQISRNGGRCAIPSWRGEWREHIAWTLNIKLISNYSFFGTNTGQIHAAACPDDGFGAASPLKTATQIDPIPASVVQNWFQKIIGQLSAHCFQLFPFWTAKECFMIWWNIFGTGLELKWKILIEMMSGFINLL